MSKIYIATNSQEHCITIATLEECHAITLYFEGFKSIIVWRNGAVNIRPVDSTKRIREIRPGDKVFCFEELETVLRVEIYR